MSCFMYLWIASVCFRLFVIARRSRSNFNGALQRGGLATVVGDASLNTNNGKKGL